MPAYDITIDNYCPTSFEYVEEFRVYGWNLEEGTWEHIDTFDAIEDARKCARKYHREMLITQKLKE